MIKNKAQKQKLLSPEAYIKEKARQLPIVECYIGTKWDYMGEKTVIVTHQYLCRDRLLRAAEYNPMGRSLS
jgi:hypothetical protein